MTKKVKKHDVVNNPIHYNWIPGIECIEVAEHFNLLLGSALQYIWRAGKKESSTKLQDLKKARWYIDREISNIEKGRLK